MQYIIDILAGLLSNLADLKCVKDVLQHMMRFINKCLLSIKVMLKTHLKHGHV